MVDVQQIGVEWICWIEESWFYGWENWGWYWVTFPVTELLSDRGDSRTWFCLISQSLCEFIPLGLGFFCHKSGAFVLSSLLPWKLWPYNQYHEDAFVCALVYFWAIYIIVKLSHWTTSWGSFGNFQSPFRNMLNNIATLVLLGKCKRTVFRNTVERESIFQVCVVGYISNLSLRQS